MLLLSICWLQMLLYFLGVIQAVIFRQLLLGLGGAVADMPQLLGYPVFTLLPLAGKCSEYVTSFLKSNQTSWTPLRSETETQALPLLAF